jgi:hypothetical protein
LTKVLSRNCLLGSNQGRLTNAWTGARPGHAAITPFNAAKTPYAQPSEPDIL